MLIKSSSESGWDQTIYCMNFCYFDDSKDIYDILLFVRVGCFVVRRVLSSNFVLIF